MATWNDSLTKNQRNDNLASTTKSFFSFNLFSFPVTLLDGTTPIKYGLRLNSESKYWDLKKQMATMCTLDADQMIICELKGSQFKLVLHDEQKIKPSTAFELFVYELPKLHNCLRSRAGSELGNNIEKGLKDIQRNQGTVVQSHF
jgi:ubiquitin carboxyl-terminal hydrolase 6/32